MNGFWKDKKVLITGGTGFLGKHLCDALLQKNALVTALDFHKAACVAAGLRFIEADIRRKEEVTDACAGRDVVFHLAAMPSIARGKAEEYYAVNVTGTRNILDAAHRHGIKKFVYVSSSTPYGIPKEFPLKETSQVNPIGKYGRSKLQAEEVCREFIAKGMNISIIRPRVIIGPGRIGIFSILFERIRNNQPVYVLGSGKNIFQFTHVSDMVDVCLKSAQYPGSDLFNAGCADILPVREELELLIRHAKSRSRIISLPAGLARAGLKLLSLAGVSPLVEEQFAIADRNFKLDTAHAREVLGWSPRYSNRESLIQAYDWYAAHAPAGGAQYKNLFGVIGRFHHSMMGGFQVGN